MCEVYVLAEKIKDIGTFQPSMNYAMKELTSPSEGTPDMVAIPALSYPRFFKIVRPSKRKSLLNQYSHSHQYNSKTV